MIFNSLEFFIFFCLVLPFAVLLPKVRFQNWLLLAASYFFYGWWDWRFLGLILTYTIVNYGVALGIERWRESARSRWMLVGCLIVDLGILAFFKYFNFFVDTLELGLGQIGIATGNLHLEIVLPVGISFYTFQTMGYTIDVYRGRLRPVTDPFLFALYVAYFPQLVAGPIERAKNLLPQLTRRRHFTIDGLSKGVWLIILGLYQKVVLADNLAAIVNEVFESDSSVCSGMALLAVVSFTLQIYGDFAGYSNIARGCSFILGIELMQNFRRPYFATNPRDFWSRWHISLSTWLRDYLYISLGGNRQGVFGTMRNLMLTMVLGGLWHGATWMFVLWGAFHGVVLILHRVWCMIRPRILVESWLKRPYSVVSWVGMSIVVAFGWLLFRAQTVAEAWKIIDALTGPWRWTFLCSDRLSLLVICFTPLLVVDILSEWIDRGKNIDDAILLLALPTVARGFVFAMLLFLLAAMSAPQGVHFIYFQF